MGELLQGGAKVAVLVFVVTCMVSVGLGLSVREVVAAVRYVDRFEKRNDEWRIAERTVVHDHMREYSAASERSLNPLGTAMVHGERGPEDRSYEVLSKL